MNQNQNNQDEELLKNWKEELDSINPPYFKSFIASLLQAVRREERFRAAEIVRRLVDEIEPEEKGAYAEIINRINNQSND